MRKTVRADIPERILVLSVHETGSAFDRHNTVSQETRTKPRGNSTCYMNNTTRRSKIVTITPESREGPSHRRPEPLRMIWCLGWESNPHEVKLRGILSPLRLPIPPPRPGPYSGALGHLPIIFKKPCQGIFSGPPRPADRPERFPLEGRRGGVVRTGLY